MRIREFDTWRPGYANATVKVFLAGTTTLANLFTDEGLTVPAINPQILAGRTDSGINYGRFIQPIYVGQACYLDINATEQTGVERPPVLSLAGQNAGGATAIATGGTVARTLADRAADLIFAEDYGQFGVSAATNTATITAAIGVAAGAGGGCVRLPARTIAHNPFTLPGDVVLLGEGRGITVLECQAAAAVITLGGDRAGLAGLTIDGVSLVGGSTGISTAGIDGTVFEDCEVKRFNTGMHFKGGRRAVWRGLHVANCATGIKMHGDINGGTANGDEYSNNAWIGGLVTQCSSAGIELSYEDRLCQHNTFQGVGFEDNTGTAVKINGARFTRLVDCWWSGNTTNIDATDDSDTSQTDENTVVGLSMKGGGISGGNAKFTKTLQDVVLEGMLLDGCTITLTAPVSNPVQLQDCVEDNVTIAGTDGTKLTRFRRTSTGASSDITSNASAIKAWSLSLQPGQIVALSAMVIARQRNGTGKAVYHIASSANRPGSTLAYEVQTANFTLGDIITGATSGAKARVTADTDAGVTGTLTLQDIDGDFIDDETITQAQGGSAKVNGALVAQNCALFGTDTATRTQEDDAAWAAAFVANLSEVELRVTGAAGKTVEWLVHVTAVQT